MEVAEEARKRADAVVEQNQEMVEQFMYAINSKWDTEISKMEGGKRVVDFDKAKQVGQEIATEITERDGALFDLNLGDDMITSPILDPNKFNPLVAAAVDLKKAHPEYFGKADTVIEDLFNLTTKGDLRLTEDFAEEFIDTLNKYGLSFEDYVLVAAGSASKAGQVLQKFSQIKRSKPASVRNADKEKKAREAGDLRKGVMRVENIRRGGLVSQIATAARNLTSGGIRVPMEALGNVMDHAIYTAQNKGMSEGVGQIFSGDNWKGSFSNWKYAFSRPDVAKGYTDLILEQPELAKQFDAMFNNINEIQKLTGRGSGTKVDNMLSLAEDVVDTLNTPNRWQEYLIRRGQFFGELERLTKREYNIDLIDALNDGKLKDLLNDASSVRPKGAPSFTELVDRSVYRALDVTYAKQPDVPVFRSVSSFITRNGLTVVMPFPRFMFNSMELAGQYSAGAFAPVIKRSINAVTGKASGPLTKEERRNISRNIIGGTVILPAAMMYRNSEDAPADYKMLRADDGTLLDTSAQSPVLRQSLWIAEWIKRNKDGTATKWMREQGYKEGVEAFIGTNIRTGTGGVIFQDVAKIFSDADAMGGERAQEYFGEAFGEYSATFLTPLNQVIEVQRAFDFRPSEYIDTRSEPTFEEQPFLRGLVAPFKRRGYTTLFTPSEEKDAPLRETIFQEGDSEARVMPLLKVFTGLTLKEDVSEAGKFLNELGFADYKIRSRSISPGFQRYETKVLREIIPSIVEAAQSDVFVGFHKDRARMRPQEARDKVSDEAYIKIQQTAFIQDQLGVYKSQIDKVITEASTAGKETDAVRSDLTTPDGKAVNVELTKYLLAQQKFRRLKPDERNAAFVALPSILAQMGREDEEPSMGNFDHLNMMLEYAKTMRVR